MEKRFIVSNKYVKCGVVGGLSALSCLAVSYIIKNTDITPTFFGTGIFGFNPVSLVFFALDFILLWRFFNGEVFLNKGRIIISALIGILMGLSMFLGVHIIFGNNDIFDGSSKGAYIIPVSLGLALLFSPMVSEITGFFDKHGSAESPEDVKEIKKGRAIGYLFLILGIVLLSFIPLFLYYWPGNFIADANYQVENWIDGGVSTHHPILHTVLLGSFYELGRKLGHPNYGFQFFTILQMLTVSGAVACFMRYLYDRRVKRSIRIIILLCFILNPALSYYAISTIKGVMCGAFTLIAVTFVLRFIDSEKIINLVGCVGFAIMACCFRNNMVYAMAVAGIVVTIVYAAKKKGIKTVIAFFTAMVLIVAGAKVSEKILIKATDGKVVDTQRESMSVPLMCLARVVKYHGEELDPTVYNEICRYIPEYLIDGYVYCISDSIKNEANENLLRDNKINFIKLVAKIGMKYPGEYLEAFSGLTCGYWYLGDYPYYVGGSTKLYCTYFHTDLPNIDNKNLLPVGGEIFDYLYGEREGRLSIPVFGWFWRGGLYFWIYVFAFFYIIYRKNIKSFAAVIFPFMYMMSCLFGPAPFLRYIVINIIMLPTLVYFMTDKGSVIKQSNNDETKNRNTRIKE